ncbi:MAG: fumarate hydratase [Elusimicrobiota bacterium]|jgi:fumarate hydratase subunit alpha|nr:fumarate hydratase [Elusimicrobiota bacterium]
MRKLKAVAITKTVAQMCVKAAHILPGDTTLAIKKSAAKENWRAKKILNLCLENADIAKKELIPLCQDTGTAVLFVEIGSDLCIEGDINKAIESGVAQGYKDGYLRKSIVSDPLFLRKNTKDNTPPVVHYSFVKGNKLKLTLMLKGAGSENNSRLTMLTPAATVEDIENFVLETVKLAGSKACPPLVVGIGIGGNFETCALLSKKALAREIGRFNKDKRYASLEKRLLSKINKLNIGPLGLGGKNTALFVSVEFAPCHMASLPLAVNIGCHSNRHITKIL